MRSPNVGPALAPACEAAEVRHAPSPRGKAAPASGRGWTRGYPDSITVLGHSGSTGESSDPDKPGVEVRENSWATGTNPEVDSLYLRILKHNPAVKDHNTPYSEGGAGIDQVAGQAARLLEVDPKPDLIVIQVMDGAFWHIVDRREYVASDLNRLSIQGHAKAAAVAWAAMHRAQVLPRAR